ncbi:hypothetical protein GPECTOR_105g102 [Gonium pectorale]|uniref:Methyltransferase small domain-containing protein n=1 Tax=Gonium pectorale TaxID=33097 RepID=A0A150FZP3_GONPE|nr:hypothetical protein GPECTOR_105g102 [Gonium pectorale]|eukprot:KXZ43048.1 hypothetical protein GPECTOR_105g102 [Gonium pectorale]
MSEALRDGPSQPQPLPPAVTERHVRCLAAALAALPHGPPAGGRPAEDCELRTPCCAAQGDTPPGPDDAAVGPATASDSAGLAHSPERSAGGGGGSACDPSAAAAAAAGSGCWGLVTLRVSANLLAGSTGCHEWEASFALAQWVLGRPELFAGRRVLELGCGAGLVAVALRRAGAALVAATDGSAEAVANCAANLALNGLGCPVVECDGARDLAALQEGMAVSVLAWEEPVPPEGLGFDTVVASDVLYDPEVVPVLVQLLARLLTAGGCTAGASAPGGSGSGANAAATTAASPTAYLATLRRNPATMELFLRSAEGAGLRLEELRCWREGGAVRFHHVPALEDEGTVGRLVLHRITSGG